MIPLISSLCRGPLGVCQLPRFWWKALTRSKGLLDEEYPECSGGLDTFVMQTLELDRENTLEFLGDTTPSYLEFESWVLDQCGGGPVWKCVNGWNDFNYGRQHYRPSKIAETYGDSGLPDDSPITSAVILNCLQDWQLFFERDLENGLAAFEGKVVPLISSLDYGPLNLRHLPRMWLKLHLEARGNLDAESVDEADHHRDENLLELIGASVTAFTRFFDDEKPHYLDLEAWVTANTTGSTDLDKRRAWNSQIAALGQAGEVSGHQRPAADSPVDRENLANWKRAYEIVF